MAMLNTVLGPIDASEIGDTMSHVHLTIDLLCWHMPPESGPQRGLSENRITMRNLGEVRRNAMRVAASAAGGGATLGLGDLAMTENQKRERASKSF